MMPPEQDNFGAMNFETSPLNMGILDIFGKYLFVIYHENNKEEIQSSQPLTLSLAWMLMNLLGSMYRKIVNEKGEDSTEAQHVKDLTERLDEISSKLPQDPNAHDNRKDIA